MGSVFMELGMLLEPTVSSGCPALRMLVAHFVQLLATPQTVACHAPLSVEFSRQEYWSGLPFPSPGDLPDSGIEPGSPALQVDSLPSEPPGILCSQPSAKAVLFFP